MIDLLLRRWATLGPGPWAWALGLALATLCAVPLAWLALGAGTVDDQVAAHVRSQVLPDAVRNTLALLAGVGLGVSALGVSLGWLVTAYEFPLRRLWVWALLLPLALPAYVGAFVWVGLLDVTSPLAQWARTQGWALPAVRSLPGAVGVLTLALYPYVYLNARAAFSRQSGRLVEAARALGHSRTSAWWRVSLPLAAPGIAAGLALALMETLADFGSVALLGVDTFTTAIYKTWLSLFSLPAAARLALGLVGAVGLALAVGHLLRVRHTAVSSKSLGACPRRVLHGPQAWAACAACAGVVALSFGVPMLTLLVWAVNLGWAQFDARLAQAALRTLSLGGASAVAITALALGLAYAQRLVPHPALNALARLATLGYALPGAVLAVAVVLPLAALDDALIQTGWRDGPLLAGSLAALALALALRFLAVGHGPLHAGLRAITLHMDEAAQSLGLSALQRLWRVHRPLLRAPLWTAAALVLVDVMKELPITLMLRPFGWDTLAVHVFEWTSEGLWALAALPALGIAAVGLGPVVWLVHQLESQHAHAD